MKSCEGYFGSVQESKGVLGRAGHSVMGSLLLLFFLVFQCSLMNTFLFKLSSQVSSFLLVSRLVFSRFSIKLSI